MSVICCFSSEPHLQALKAILRFYPQTEFVKTEGLFGYPQVIAARWDASDDLIVIEGDKEINSSVIPSFSACSELWCTYAYETLPAPYTKRVTYGLGCAKFSAELQRIVHSGEFICEDVPWQPCRHCGGRGCWNQLDVRMARAFEAHGVSNPHVHGQIIHHHKYDPMWWREWKKDWDYLMDVDARMREIAGRK